MSNAELWGWFDDGNATFVVLGAEPFFVRDHTYLDMHDRLLAIGELVDWAQARGRDAEASHDVLTAIRMAVADADTWAAYDVVWSYLLTEEAGRRLRSLDLATSSSCSTRPTASRERR